jgi:uncharacterized RDD family membrane protein YckC
MRRVLAAIIDYGLFLFLLSCYGRAVGEPVGDGTVSIKGLPFLGALAFWAIFFPVAEAVFGVTLGKAITRLKVVTEEGRRISWKAAFKRHILDIVDVYLSFGLVALITAKVTPKGQRVGDFWAKTRVVMK